MRKFFTLIAVLMLVLTSGGLLLTACGKEKQVAITIEGGLPDGVASISTDASYESSPIATKTYRKIYFTMDEGCKGWGSLSLTVKGIKSDETKENILENGTKDEGDIKKEDDSRFSYELPASAIDTYEKIELSFSGKAEFEMVTVKLTLQDSYTTLSTENLRFNVKSNGELVEVAKEPATDEEPETTTELTFEQLKTLFGEDGFETPKNKDFEIVAWATDTANSLKAIEMNGQSSTSQHSYRYENEVVKTTLLIDKISENITVELPDASKEWFDSNSQISLSLCENSETSDYLFGNASDNTVSNKVFAGQQEITSFSDLKAHCDEELTIKFESTKEYSILNYLAEESANFQFLNQKDLKLTKEESETDGNAVYSVGNITNPFKTGDDFVFLITPVFSEIANLDGLMIAPSVNSVDYNGSSISLYDRDGSNNIIVNDENINKMYVLKDGSFDYSYVVDDEERFNIDDVKSKVLTVTYAKGKTITITFQEDLNVEESNTETEGTVTLSSTYGNVSWLGKDAWTISLHFDKISICDLEIINIELK